LGGHIDSKEIWVMSYLPSHRAPTNHRRGLRVVGAASAALGTILACSSPAAAFDNYTESFSNDGSSIGRCALTLTNANYTNGTVRANINASVKPTTPAGVFNNTHVAVYCFLYSKPGGVFLKSFSVQQAGPLASGSNISTQPLYPDYFICTQVETTLRSGATTCGPFNCAG
jgi:hypothetical protein